MEISLRDAVTVVHGMFFGALLLLMFTGAAMGLYASGASGDHWTPGPRQRRYFSIYLALMALLAWLAVLVGAYAVIRNACSCPVPARPGGTISAWSGRSTLPGSLRSV
jgi:hypothetical protein